MKDVQSGPAGVALPIDRVGVRGLVLPLRVRERADTSGLQRTVARVDASVDLPATFKGTHMSRFVEALNAWAAHSDGVDYQAVRELLQDIRTRLEARRAHVVFRFPYFMTKAAPSSGINSLMHYECALTGLVDDTAPHMEFLLEVTVPVMTVCPCSKAISDEGAHSQRAEVRMAVRMRGFCWIEDLVEAAEASGSSPVYAVLKREDEKYVTEHAFAEPTFVEDVVRNVAQRLARHPHITSYSVEVESFESIHAHNAFARIEGQGMCWEDEKTV